MIYFILFLPSVYDHVKQNQSVVINNDHAMMRNQSKEHEEVAIKK